MRLKPRLLLGSLNQSRSESLWTQLARSSTATLLGISGLLWFLSYFYLRLASSRDPTSYFFDGVSGYERRYSLQREREAYSFIRSANNTRIELPKSKGEPSMCVGVATIARPSGHQYVRGTIGSLLEGLSAKDRETVYLMPFIAHTEPAQHPIYKEPWLTALSDRVLQYDAKGEDLVRLQQFEEGHHWRNKSMYDYGYLLEKCHDTGAAWIAMIEDDVLARDGWYTRSCQALQDLAKTSASERWVYLRMFYTEGLLGWNSEEWPRYFGWSFATFLVLFAILVGARARYPRLQRQVSNLNAVTACAVILPSFIILYFMAGRGTMQPFSKGVHRMDRFGCCSQGFIFPRAIVPELIERTKKAMNEDYYIDMLLERWADAEALERYVLTPSLLQHVGDKSSKGWGYDANAVTTWNFGFEDHPP
ncbi:MAG: hypothetical protein Q9183_004864 [Haloplaca sp. 2 TL-2023]